MVLCVAVRPIGIGIFCGLLVAACGSSPPSEPAAAPATAAQPSPDQAFAWPAGFRLMDDGFPSKGDACRRLGETALTSNYLDDSARLVGCPGGAENAAATAIVAVLGGKVVGSAEGVTLISIPTGDANQGMPGS